LIELGVYTIRAESLGLDPSYFSRFIRREIETSPVELRNRISRKVPEIHAIVPGLVFGSLLQLRNLIPMDGGSTISYGEPLTI
jgi:hypothetical protein